MSNRISTEKLLTELKTQYNVICFENLGDYNQDSALLYQLFAKLHKEYYQPNERLVFYTGSKPSQRLIEHIQRSADRIDISQCFIMLCGPVGDCITGNLDFFSIEVDCDDLLPDNLIDLNTFCPLPFFHMSVMNKGLAKACCVYEYDIESVKKSSLESVFDSQPWIDIRKDFIDGKRHDGCRHCWKLEDQGIMSNRQWHLDFYEKAMFVGDWIKNLKLRSLDYRPSNICNFKCRICSPSSSSLFAAEKLSRETYPAEISRLKDIVVQGQWFNDDPRFFQEIQRLLPNMVQIDFYGGEPFLLKQLSTLLETAVESDVAQNIRLHFNTNGSIWPEHLIPLMSKFKKVDISVSIDNIKERFELERGGQWSEIEHNILKFLDLGAPFMISVTPTINIQNVLYLPEFLDWVKQKRLNVFFNYLDYPESLCIDNMTGRAKEIVVNKLSAYQHSEVKKIIARIQQSPGSDGREFVQKMKDFDSYRGQDFRLSHKEIAEAMGYVL